jgi:serine/threonine protein kinase
MTRPVTTPGRLVAGRYRLQSQIGGGGMGTVWLARDELLGRQVAIKQVLSPAGMSAEETDQQRQRALREGRIAARLSHPHAISVYDVALESGQPWLVMEYLPSRSLAAVLAQDGVLRVDQVAQIGAQVADALAATHAAGIVHRDVKPANILIGEGGRVEGLVKITDFGISHASGDIQLTQTGQITGTPAFLSPEVAQGREMTEASDVFSLGATLYTCIEGTPPFGMEDNALAMLHRVAGGQIVPPQRAGSLTTPLLRMLAPDPADRPAMPEVRDQLATLAAGRGGDTTTVLLGRTDLRTGGQNLHRTATFPAVAAVDGGTPAPAAAAEPTPVPPRPPVRTQSPFRSESGRHRGRAVRVAAALVVAVLAGLLAFWLLVPDDRDPSDEASTPPAGTSGSAEPSAEQTQSSSAEPTETAEPTDTVEPTDDPPAETTPAEVEPLSVQNIESFLAGYHDLVLDDPQAAYARTGPTLRATISEDNYIDYWQQFEDVRISDIQATDGQSTATATMELRYSGGGSETSRRAFTFLVQDGQLILDSDYAAG